MKILHIVPSYKPAYIYGGPIESVSKLCEGLAAAGNDVDVYTTTANGKVELDVKANEVINVDGVNVTYFSRQVKDPTHVSFGLWVHVWKNVKRYDIVNVQSWWNILVMIAACICLIRGAKVVVSPRGMLSKYVLTSGRSMMKKILHASIGKWALSKVWLHATAEVELIEFNALLGEVKGFVAANIVTLPDRLVVKRAHDTFTLIYMSRLHPKKGLEHLFQAISSLTFPVLLRIAGSGNDEYIRQLKDLAVKLKIDHQLEWVGWLNRDEKFTALMDADLFVLASQNENFANVVLESLHMGTPVMVSKYVALSTFVEDNQLGWVSSLAAANIADKIAAAHTDTERKDWIHKNGRSFIEANFSEEQVIKAYLEEYQKIINN